MPKLSFSTRDSAIFAEKAKKSSVFSPQIFCPLTDPYQIWWVGRYWGDTLMVEKAKTSPGNFGSWAWPNKFLTLSGAPTSPLIFDCQPDKLFWSSAPQTFPTMPNMWRISTDFVVLPLEFSGSVSLITRV